MKVQRAGEVKASTCTPSVLQWQRPLAKPRSVISPCSHVCVCFLALVLAVSVLRGEHVLRCAH